MNELGGADIIARWRRYQSALPYSEPARYAIIDSWARSEAAGLTRLAVPQFCRVTDLAERLTRCDELLQVARPRLEAFQVQLPGTSNVVYLADADGIVLFSQGPADQLVQWGLTPGHDWSEKAMGTNGAGTALAARMPIAVVGSEHFSDAFATCTCTGAPILGPDRSLIGAVDASSTVADAQPERLAAVIALAQAIERELYDRWRARLKL